MIIKQFHIGPWGHYVNDDPYVKAMHRNRCVEYKDPTQPAFFLSSTAIDYILNTHTGPAVIIMNSNPLKMENRLDEIKKRKNIYFISSSAIMSNYLDKLGLSYIEFPWELEARDNWEAVTKGPCIYVYGEGPSHNMYGWPTIKRIVNDHFPHIKIITASHKLSGYLGPRWNYYTNEELEKIYPKCFISLRLTRFDGLSGTVQDLGCKGIKTIWNGGSPSGLNYETDQDIINHIRNEEKTIGQKNTKLSKEVIKFLDMDRQEYDYIFDLSTYTLNDTNVDILKAPKLFKKSKVPATFFRDLIDNMHSLNAPSSWKDNNGVPRWGVVNN
tara:strand:- start:4374 stop:5354 length:981 start_codon:yes stop_codon:yes gene_type:complete